VPPPSLKARCDILSLCLASICDGSVGLECIQWAAAETKGFSGADLENLCRSAGVFASARGATAVGSRDIEAVLRKIRKLLLGFVLIMLYRGYAASAAACRQQMFF
jgi:ATP-dependent Zn protease